MENHYFRNHLSSISFAYHVNAISAVRKHLFWKCFKVLSQHSIRGIRTSPLMALLTCSNVVLVTCQRTLAIHHYQMHTSHLHLQIRQFPPQTSPCLRTEKVKFLHSNSGLHQRPRRTTHSTIRHPHGESIMSVHVKPKHLQAVRIKMRSLVLSTTYVTATLFSHWNRMVTAMTTTWMSNILVISPTRGNVHHPNQNQIYHGNAHHHPNV